METYTILINIGSDGASLNQHLLDTGILKDLQDNEIKCHVTYDILDNNYKVSTRCDAYGSTHDQNMVVGSFAVISYGKSLNETLATAILQSMDRLLYKLFGDGSETY